MVVYSQLHMRAADELVLISGRVPCCKPLTSPLPADGGGSAAAIDDVVAGFCGNFDGCPRRGSLLHLRLLQV